jgi:hypothetical protein
MSKVRITSLVALCGALAACSDPHATRTVTAPDVRPALSVAPADVGFGLTPDGPFDVFFATGEASAQQAAAQLAAAQQPATGSRASGHVGFTFGVPTVGLSSERYSFVALSTGPAPTFAATGEFEVMLTAAAGFELKFHGDVICMSTVGNVARIAGRITKGWVNNVPTPITGAGYPIWTVTDNGEGQRTTDTASPMFFNSAANAQLHCTVGFPPPQFPVQEGNVQVRP